MDFKRIFAGLLTACFLFVHVLGSAVAFEIEHSHHGDAEHEHELAGYRVSTAESDHHDHAPVKPHEDEQPEDGSTPPSHTHVVSLSVDVPTHISAFPGFEHQVVPEELFRPERERCPDAPSFEVIKPPQLV